MYMKIYKSLSQVKKNSKYDYTRNPKLVIYEVIYVFEFVMIFKF